MATRALYVFNDDHVKITVYKHWDGYPEARGAYGFIRAALAYAWDLPRFEADDYAAAFVAANKKKGGGDVRLLNEASTNADALGIEFTYTATLDGDRLKVMTHAHWDSEAVFAPVYITRAGITGVPVIEPLEVLPL